MKTGDKIVPTRGNSLLHFTAYKVYEVVAGEGDVNISPTALKHGAMVTHSERTCNVLDDLGQIRFISMQYFRPFSECMGLYK